MPSSLFLIPTIVAAVLTALLGLLLLGLRFMRRGLARFHLVFPFLCVALLPTAIGAAVTARGLRQTLGDLAATGSGGFAATAAGSAEAQIALALGLASSALLGLLALVLVAGGTSRTATADERARLPVVSLLLTLALAGVGTLLAAAEIVTSILLVTRTATVASFSVPSIQLVLALLILCVLPLLIVYGLLQAPRERPRPSAVVLALILPLVAIGCAGALAAGAAYTTHCLTQVALTGSPTTCPLTADAGASLPQPSVADQAQEAPSVPPSLPPSPPPDLASPQPPPPPPPPPPPARRARTADAGSGRHLRANGTPADAPEGEDLSVDGGVEGGVSGGVVGGVVGGRGEAPPPVQAVRVGGQVKEPKKLKHVPPVYPPIARQARVQGAVILEVLVAPTGRVRDVRVVRGHPLLDAAAIDAVRQWAYTPTLLNGVPVPVIMMVTVNFRIN